MHKPQNKIFYVIVHFLRGDMHSTLKKTMQHYLTNLTYNLHL